MKSLFFGGNTTPNKILRSMNTIVGVTGFVILLSGVVGCAPSSDGGPGGSLAAAGQKPVTVEEQIKQVENNPNMPPQAKQAALASMRASYTQRGKAVPAALQPQNTK